MNIIKYKSRILILVITFMAAIGATYINATPAYSHGGKTHGGEAFTAFEAAQKAIQLYDRLITSEKLTGTWETGLKTINIDVRNSAGKREYVVQFERTKGDPGSVYFFFNQEGEYSGSNFTGE